MHIYVKLLIVFVFFFYGFKYIYTCFKGKYIFTSGKEAMTASVSLYICLIGCSQNNLKRTECIEFNGIFRKYLSQTKEERITFW